jgi:hypothetical protein
MITGNATTREVLHDGKPLDLARSLRLRRHSPDGFAWGYLGSGCSQLALALLLEFTTEQEALARYHDFKADLVQHLPIDQDFIWPDSLIETWLADRPEPTL